MPPRPALPSATPREHPAAVVLVAGASGSGKSTVALRLETALGAQSVGGARGLDTFFLVNKIKTELKRNWETPDGLDWAAIKAETRRLREQGGVVVVEGFLAMHDPELVAVSDVCILVAVPESVARERRWERDRHLVPNLTRERFDKFYDHVWKHYLEYLPVQKENVRAAGKELVVLDGELPQDELGSAAIRAVTARAKL